MTTELTTAEKVRVLAGRKNMSLADIAAATGQTRQNLSNKLSRGRLCEKDLRDIAEACGVEFHCGFKLPDGAEI